MRDCEFTHFNCLFDFFFPDNPQTLNCNATFSGFTHGLPLLQMYANDQLDASYDYLLMSAHYANYIKNRPGFEKQFRSLSDTAWQRTIGLIKYITKRGGAHSFNSLLSRSTSTATDELPALEEVKAMAYALDVEKKLALAAHRIHERYSHASHKSGYDAAVSHYMEEEFIEDQANTIRKLSGFNNDLRRFVETKDDSGRNVDASLAVHLFDEYLKSV